MRMRLARAEKLRSAWILAGSCAIAIGLFLIRAGLHATTEQPQQMFPPEAAADGWLAMLGICATVLRGLCLILLALILAGILGSFYRLYGQAYLRHWSLGWLALVVYVGASVGVGLGVGSIVGVGLGVTPSGSGVGEGVGVMSKGVGLGDIDGAWFVSGASGVVMRCATGKM